MFFSFFTSKLGDSAALRHSPLQKQARHAHDALKAVLVFHPAPHSHRSIKRLEPPTSTYGSSPRHINYHIEWHAGNGIIREILCERPPGHTNFNVHSRPGYCQRDEGDRLKKTTYSGEITPGA